MKKYSFLFILSIIMNFMYSCESEQFEDIKSNNIEFLNDEPVLDSLLNLDLPVIQNLDSFVDVKKIVSLRSSNASAENSFILETWPARMPEYNFKREYNNQKIFIHKNPENGWNPFSYSSSYYWICDITEYLVTIQFPNDNFAVRAIIDENSGWSGASPNDQTRYAWVEYDLPNRRATVKTRLYYVKSNLMGQSINKLYPISHNDVCLRVIVYM